MLPGSIDGHSEWVALKWLLRSFQGFTIDQVLAAVADQSAIDRRLRHRLSGRVRTSLHNLSKPRQAITPSSADNRNNQALRPVEPGT